MSARSTGLRGLLAKRTCVHRGPSGGSGRQTGGDGCGHAGGEAWGALAAGTCASPPRGQGGGSEPATQELRAALEPSSPRPRAGFSHRPPAFAQGARLLFPLVLSVALTEPFPKAHDPRPRPGDLHAHRPLKAPGSVRERGAWGAQNTTFHPPSKLAGAGPPSDSRPWRVTRARALQRPRGTRAAWRSGRGGAAGADGLPRQEGARAAPGWRGRTRGAGRPCQPLGSRGRGASANRRRPEAPSVTTRSQVRLRGRRGPS